MDLLKPSWLHESSTRRDYLEITGEAWKAGILKWKLWDQQIVIYDLVRGLPKDVQELVILCARQYGKSLLGTLLAIEDALRNPGYTIPIVGPTLKQTTAIVNQAVRNIERDDPFAKHYIHRSKSEGRWYIGKERESELVVGGFDVKTASRLRGGTALKIYMEEIVDSNPDEYIEAIRSDLSPMLTHSPHPQIIYLTTPPRVPDHPFLTVTVPEARARNAFYKFTIDQNAELSQEQKDACATRSGGVDSVEYRREYLCEVVRDPRVLIIPDFDERRIVASTQCPTSAHYGITIDWGGVRDKTVALLHCYDFFNDKMLFMREYVADANTPTHIIVENARKLVEHVDSLSIKSLQFCVDAPGQLQVDLQAVHGLDCSTPPKDNWQAAVNQLAVLFATGKALIDPQCKLLIETCRSGMFNKTKTDFDRSSALGHCDAIAAAMYANRVQNREMPYEKVPLSQNVFPGKKEQLNQEIDVSITGRRFGGFK